MDLVLDLDIPMVNEKVMVLEKEPIKQDIPTQQEHISRQDDLVFKLLHLNRMYNTDRSVPYFKALYKEVDMFRKNTFLHLSKLDIEYVKLLSEYKMTEIRSGIKEALSYFETEEREK